MELALRNLGVAIVVALLLLTVAGGPSAAGNSPPSQDVVESSGLSASSEVQALLADVPHLIEIGRLKEASAKSDEAVELALQTNDRAGVALAQRSRAGVMQRLKRNDEALASWRGATSIWQELGDGPRQVEGLASTGVLLLAQNAESAEGRELIDRALALAKEEEADDPFATAQALHDAGETAMASKHRDSALRLLSTAIAILERHPPASVALAESLIRLGWTKVGRDLDPAAARVELDRALEIARRVAPGRAIEAECLAWKGALELRLQDFTSAVDLFQQALEIYDRVDPVGFETSTVLLWLGECQARIGDLAASRRSFLRALSIREEIEADPLEVAGCLSSVGVVEFFAGNLDAAQGYFERAVHIQEEFGDDPVTLAQTLINLGNVSVERWRFDLARERYEEALALLEQHAPTHDARGKAVGNLGEMCRRQGDYDAAESYSKREMAFFEEHFPDSLELSIALTGAGNIALERGDPSVAKAYHSRALEIRERKTPDSSLVSESLLFVAEACLELGELDQAEVHLRRGLEIAGGDSATGQEAAQILASLGEVAYRRGDFEQAERRQRRAMEVWEGLGRRDDPNVEEPLFLLGKALRGLNRPSEAFDVALKAESVRLDCLQTSSRTLTEREALAYGVTHQGALDLALTLATEAGGRIPDAPKRALDALIRSRAAVLDEVAARNRHLWTGSDPELTARAKDYAEAGDDLARLVVQGPADDPAEFQKELDEARTVKDRAERTLASASSEFRRDLAREQAGFDEVADRMASAGELVAYVRFERITPPTAQQPPANSANKRSFEYAAFVLAKGSSEPVLVSLGSAEEIDAHVAELRRQISSALVPGPGTGKRATDQYRSVGARLREQVWDPVAQQLGDSNRVFVVPDGALNLVELAALPVGEFEYLVETGPRIHYLSAERDVLAFEDTSGAGGLLAMGDPAFDEPSLFAVLAPEGNPVKLDEAYRVASAATYRGLRSSCAGFASMHFEPLPATGVEVDEVVGLWNRQPKAHTTSGVASSEAIGLRGASASEAAFKSLASGTRMIHLATHGFFLGEGCPSAIDGARSPAIGGVARAVAGENPLLLSGFALAGANHRDAAGPDEEDGILTAEEIASLNMTNVEWAVLSGCDTGVGEVRVGEGVFGLRRAFQVAGARTLIMSLWPVEDETTRKWMKALYDNRFAKGMSTIDAVHEANLTVLRQRREAGLSTHPAYWAGFIASGDWR